MAEVITIVTPYGNIPALHWYLTEREIMWQALKELIDNHACRGVVMEWPDLQGNQVWRIEGNDDAGHSFTAEIGQHIVMVEGESITVADQKQYEYMKFTEGE